MRCEDIQQETEFLRVFDVKVAEGEVGTGSLLPTDTSRQARLNAEIQLERRDVFWFREGGLVGAGGDGLAGRDQAVHGWVCRQSLAHVELAEFPGIGGVA